MEAKELMIGDWVQDITPVVIDAISNEDICTYRDENGYITANPSNLKPIPLTTEILEKNGFGDSFATNEKIFKCEDFEIWIDFKEQGYWTCIKNKVSDIYFEGNKRYVHELQHALRLCGIGKEIIL